MKQNKIDFKPNESKAKSVAKTHRGITSRYIKSLEKDQEDFKIIDIVAQNNLVVQNFNDYLKTASTDNIKIIDQDINHLVGK